MAGKADPHIPRIPWKIQDKEVEAFLKHSSDKDAVSGMYADLIVIELLLTKLVEEKD
jgi:hypothetical protein